VVKPEMLGLSEWLPFLPRKRTALYQLQPFQAGVTVLTDDDVIVHGNAQGLRVLDNHARHLDVGVRGRRLAGGMVMPPNHGAL
jgi:hypothetical protein